MSKIRTGTPTMNADDAPGSAVTQRLDRWLWFARLVKSRTLAASLVADGRVRINRDRIDKPSQPVRVGDVVTATVNRRVRVVRVAGLGARRGPPAEAHGLYDDLSPPVAPADRATTAPGERNAGAGRPTKRERRAIERLQSGNGFGLSGARNRRTDDM